MPQGQQVIGLKYRWDFLLPALLCYFVAFLSLVYPGFLVIAAMGTGLLLIQSGAELDADQKRFRKVHAWFGLKWGAWRSLEGLERIELRYESQVSSTSAPLPLPSGSNPKSRTFDLVFITSDKEQHVYEFVEYTFAVQVIHALEKLAEVPVWNAFGEISEKARARRRR